MKTIELKGIIKLDYTDSWMTIKLVQDDGYLIDLVGRFREAVESFNNHAIQVKYYLSYKPCDKNEIKEGFLKTLFGDVDASFESNAYSYSEWTTGTEYDTNLTIGGHDLFRELESNQGMFIFIEINFIEK